MGYTPQITAANIIMGAAAFLINSRDTAAPTVTPLASPAPAVGSFTVNTADAAKLRPGDVLQLVTATPTYLPDEASTMPVVQSIVLVGGNYLVTVLPVFGSAPASASASVRQLWSNRGATFGGIGTELSKETKDLEADQVLVAVDAVDQKLGLMVTAKFTETTLNNAALVAGLKDPTNPLALNINSTDTGRRDRVLVVGKAPNGKTRWQVFHKVASSGKATDTYTKDGQRIYDYQGKCYVDSSMTPDTAAYLDV